MKRIVPRRRKKTALHLLRHSRRRVVERYGAELSEDNIRTIGRLIREGRSKLLRKDSINFSKHLVEFEGTEYRVVYDKKRRAVVTFLPPLVYAIMREEEINANI
jgi:hypothetical protein